MNTIKPGSHGRTKDDIAKVRHIYLDFDDNGTAAVHALMQRSDVPTPNYLVNSSSGKWQICRYRHNCHNADSGIMPRAMLVTRPGSIS
jgi:hypothetical protein